MCVYLYMGVYIIDICVWVYIYVCIWRFISSFFVHAEINDDFIKMELSINYADWKEKNYVEK